MLICAYLSQQLKYFSFLLKLVPILFIIVLFLQVRKGNATGRLEYDSEEEIFEVATDRVPLCRQGHRMNMGTLFPEGECNLCVQHFHGYRWFCQSCSDHYCCQCVYKYWPLFRFGRSMIYLFRPEYSIVSSGLSKLKGIPI